MERIIISLLVVAAWVSLPVAVMSQPRQEVQVHLADRFGAGVPSIVITLRDEGGLNELASGSTDANGEVSFPNITNETVRLSVSGAAPSGVAVSLGQVSFIDDDAILVRTNVGGPLVDLVMDTDGFVYINPETLEPENASGGPELSSPSEQPAVSTEIAGTQPQAGATPDRGSGTRSGWPWWLLLLIGGGLTGLVLWMGSERRVS